LEPAVEAKMLTFVLPTKKRLIVVSFGTFFQISQEPRRIRKNWVTKNFCSYRQGRWQKKFQGGPTEKGPKNSTI